MGNKFSANQIANYENVKNTNGLLIHVMDKNQLILISGTLLADMEEDAINSAIDKNNFDKPIIIYGKNSYDIQKLIEKQKQLVSLGFINVKIYIGGMFEWALLQDVYGAKEFPTNGAKGLIDPIMFKAK